MPNQAEDVRFWASRTTAEQRQSNWNTNFYLCPPEVYALSRQTESTQGQLIGLVGQQGVGKSSALNTLYEGLPTMLTRKSEKILFKWKPITKLYYEFIDSKHELHDEFMKLYCPKILEEIKAEDREKKDYRGFALFEIAVHELATTGSSLTKPDLNWAERMLSSRTVARLREETCYELISRKHIILIDSPDYSKTDKRRMHSDLTEISELWNRLLNDNPLATITVAIQKEMSQDHFFLGKMRIIELNPLTTTQIVEIYLKQFKISEPFNDDALTQLAQYSRGVFRRFLRYITLSLDIWESKYRRTTKLIDISIIKEAVTPSILAKDLELELSALFPNSNQQRILAITIITQLQEHEGTKQSDLAKQLNINPYTLSRVLTRLEESKYIIRTQNGQEKTIKLNLQR